MNDLWFFLKLFKPQRANLAVGMLLSLLTALSSVALLTLSGWFISASALAGLNAEAWAFNFVLPAAQIRALAIARTASRYAERLVTHEATFHVLANIRGWFFQQLIPLVPGRLSSLRSGDVLSRMTADIDALDALYLRLLSPALVAALGVGAVTAFLYLYAPIISLNTGVMLALASVAVPWLFTVLGRGGAEETVVLAANFRIRHLDMLQGLADLLAYRAYPRFNALLDQCSRLMVDTQRRNNRLTAISSALTLLLSQSALLAALLMAALLYRDRLLSGAESVMLVFCVLAAFEFAMPLPQALQMLAKTGKAAQRIRQVAQMSPTITSPRQPSALPYGYGLQLDDVSFRYPNQPDWALRQVSLSIPQNSKLAIIGASGSGKTTLLHMLMRYYDADQGRILLAGHNLKQFDSDDLLTRYGVLSQRSELFAATIKDNLLIAKPKASAAELAAALSSAGLRTLINRLPDGIDTWVGESGLKVSGGEARRIALARLYLKNAPILILDEPTEGLDKETEREVLNTLAAFAQDKTLIIVTHREAGLDLADKVYRMERGVLIGTSL
ncbi:MAG: thiol reductant ABC exporter subunit CydC [Methylovulum sp.]|nr:thiol reductant ABC exporter subunit CydC [Methylovulum sp.]